MAVGDVFVFVGNAKAYFPKDGLVARVVGDIQTPRQPFDVLYESLELPGYFGLSWNALYDCLCDFHWVKSRDVVMVHEDLPSLNKMNLKLYLEILRDAIAGWREGDSHRLQVVFDEKCREYIESIFSSS